MTCDRKWFVVVFVFICAVPLCAGAEDDAQKLADRIDELVGAKLTVANIEPALRADDATFYRRFRSISRAKLRRPPRHASSSVTRDKTSDARQSIAYSTAQAMASISPMSGPD